MVVLAGIFLFQACGSDGGSIRIVTNGVVRETSAQQILCVAGGVTGAGIAGNDGYLAAPLVCSVSFRTDGYFADYLELTAFDVPAAFQYLGTWLPVGGGLIDAWITLQGQEQPIFNGAVRFTEISNVVGRRVCAQYAFETGLDVVEGEFCTEVQVGY